jgi:hypothetical protein
MVYSSETHGKPKSYISMMTGLEAAHVEEVGVVLHHCIDLWRSPMASAYLMRFIE